MSLVSLQLRWLLGLLLSLPLLPLLAAGQATSRDLSEVSLEELANTKVYTASRHLQTFSEAPSSVTVITSAEIKRFGYRTLADILRSVRSFYTTYDRNYTYLGVRGFARPGDFNTRILLLVDGHRINDNIYDQAAVGTELALDIDLIERVEVVRGPVSSLYGTSAFFAVVNIITRKGRDFDGFEFSSDAASFASYQGRISYGRRLSQWEYLVSGSFYGSRGHPRLFYPEFNSPADNYGYTLNADDDQVGSFFGTASFRDFTIQAAYGTRAKGVPTASFDTVFNHSGNRTIDSHAYIDLRYQRDFASRWSVLARAYCDRYTYHGHYLYSYPDNPSALVENLDFADGKWAGGELQLTRVLFRRHRLTGGGEYRNNFRQYQSNYDLLPFTLYLDSRQSSFVGAVYLQDEFTITSRLTLNAGFRYDHYDSLSGSTNPRAALIFRPHPSTALKFVYGTAFRAPNVYELYYEAPSELSNPNLAPETIRTTELVWEQQLRKHLRFSASAYYNSIDGLISQAELPDGSSIFANLEQAKSKGLELELNSKWAGGWEGTLSYGVQETRNRDTNLRLTNSPGTLLKLKLVAPLYRKNLFAGLDAQYTGRRGTIRGQSVGGFPIVNLTLFGSRIGKHAAVSASVYNLFDRAYFDPGGAEHRQDAIQQDGRSFRLKFTWNWGLKMEPKNRAAKQPN